MDEDPKNAPSQPDVREAEGDQAQDDSAAPAPETRQRRLTSGERIIVGILVALIAVAGILFAFMLSRFLRPDDTQRDPCLAVPRTHAHLDRQEMGSAEAKVRLVCLLPLKTGCQAPTIEYLHDAVQMHPEEMHVRFVDYLAPHGKEEAKQYQLTCASVVINKASRFKDASGRDIQLGGPYGEGYSVADVHYVLQKAFDEAYGKGVVVLDAPTAE